MREEASFEYVEGSAAAAAGYHPDAWITVVGFDPGVTTGWSWFSLPVDRLLRPSPASIARRLRCGDVWAGEISLEAEREKGYAGVGHVAWDNHSASEMVQVVANALKDTEHDPEVDLAYVVVEDFILRLLDSGRALLAPVRITAAFEYGVGTGALGSLARVHKFSPGDGKRVVTDARLREWGLYEAGSPHPRDARRQAVLFLRRWATDAGFRTRAGAGLVNGR